MTMTLEPCPFCGMAVEYVTRPVSYGREFWYVYHPEHPSGDCILEDQKFSSAHVWNRRTHLTQPAQAVDVGAWRVEFDTLLEDYVTARVQTALHNVTQHSEGWIKLPRPRLQSLNAHVEKLTRALSGEKAGRVGDGWISVEDRLPEPCKFVLASFLNSYGKGRVIRAMYAAPKTLEMHMDAEGGEYDEETDTYWCEAGWYEANENEEVHWFVAEKVTHWQPLPASPTPDKE